ncbi:hypothetical protein THIX_10304 [Thiomonas sp. X19]|uniref:hypothetical protein n=1 Tax=Thiomonas sp. X19 TaxID=1050370 RepID=UPI000B70FCFA|nr:hypothetical protein [Thiomonas sp. X19]SCC91263.1 hypothetical protein THIX_10304 [Thiomonas sp. X19]
MRTLRVVRVIAAWVFVSLLAACGGGGSGGGGALTSSTGGTATGYLIDAPVAGASYTTSSGLSGVTANDGSFTYHTGDKIKFTVLGIGLGNAVAVPANGVVTPVTITGEDSSGATVTTANAPNATLMAQLLQTLGNISPTTSNGALVMPTTNTALQQQLVALFNSGGLTAVVNGLQTALSNAGITGVTVVSSAAAISTMNAAIQATTSAAASPQYANSTWTATGSGGGATLQFLANGTVEGLTGSQTVVYGIWTVNSDRSLTVNVAGGGGGTATATLTSADLAANPSSCSSCLQVTPGNGTPWTGSMTQSSPGSQNPYAGIWFSTFTPNSAGTANNMQSGTIAFIAESNGSIFGQVLGQGNASANGSWTPSTGAISGSGSSGGSTTSMVGSFATQTGTLSVNGTVVGSLNLSRNPPPPLPYAGVYSGHYKLSCPGCNGGNGESANGTMMITVNSDGTFSTVTSTTFTSNINGDNFGANVGFQGRVASSGAINASAGNNPNGCQNFFAAPWTSGQITNGMLSVTYSQQPATCPAVSGSITATFVPG